MIKKIFKILFYVLQTSILFSSSLLTPKEFLGYELGDKFSFHHDAVNYFQHVSEISDHIHLIHYGETYEGRPLIAAVVTHPDNTLSLDMLRNNHLISSGLKDGKVPDKNFAVVWLSYSVHGNESSSMEAALKTIYSFADKTNTDHMQWLKKVVIIVDPCINPDGRDRYANFFRMTGNFIPDVDPSTRSHREPWPGGRTNHYYHDLNRDWCWQSQKETKSRMKLYKKWLPHVHVDYHEQSYNEPYYFAPAVQPYHSSITNWQKEFQEIIGNNNVKYFDSHQLLYFRNEEFDLLYPGFGDTYPIFNGALGMTYEKAGSGSGGVAVKTSATDTLTLKERIEHHYLTGISTVEATYQNADRIISEFNKYFTNSNSSKRNNYHTYIISKENNINKINDLIHLLNINGIKYGYLRSKKSKSIKSAFHYSSGQTKSIKVTDADLCIPVNQHFGILANVLFEPKTILTDTLTYDITAWSLPYVFGLDAYAVDKKLDLKITNQLIIDKKIYGQTTDIYGYLVQWGSMNELRFLAELLKNKVTVRIAEKPFSHSSTNYQPGALFISPRGNEHLGEKLHKIVNSAASKHQPDLLNITTGASSKGIDLGSSNFNTITKPRIGVLSGDGISSNNFGEIWYFFEQQINFPISIFRSSDFKSIPLDKLDVLILPNGSYDFLKTEMTPNTQIKKETGASVLIKSSPPPKLLEWVSNGGRMIIIGSAMEKFVDQKGYGLVKYESEITKKEEKKIAEEEKLKDRNKKYGTRRRDRLRDSIYGNIVKIEVDNSHPLAFGYDKIYFNLKLEKKLYPLLSKGWNVGILKDSDSHIAGFMGNRIKKKIDNNLIFGVQDVKKGRIIYFADNPLLRSFWYNSNVLFGNAAFFVTN